MENIEINAKLIITVVLISAVLGTLLWAGYNIYIDATQEENEGIEYFESDMTFNANNNIQAEISNNNNHGNNTEFDISDIIGDEGFEINNSNAVVPKDGWVKRKYHCSGDTYSTMYYIPNDWKYVVRGDKKNGTSIKADSLEVDNLIKQTTYEEALNKFIKTKETAQNSPDEVQNYKKRTININDKNLYVLVKEEYYNAIYEYFCLIKDNKVYYLEMSTSKENYNQELINDLNEIYSTFRIY